MDDGPGLEPTRIGGEKLRGEVVRALDHDVDPSHELPGVLRQETAPDQLDPGRQPPALESPRGSIQLVAPDIVVRIEDLTMQVRDVHDVVVREDEPAHSCVGEGEERGASEPAHADDQDARVPERITP